MESKGPNDTFGIWRVILICACSEALFLLKWPKWSITFLLVYFQARSYADSKQQEADKTKNEYASQLQNTNQQQNEFYNTQMPQVFQVCGHFRLYTLKPLLSSSPPPPPPHTHTHTGKWPIFVPWGRWLLSGGIHSWAVLRCWRTDISQIVGCWWNKYYTYDSSFSIVVSIYQSSRKPDFFRSQTKIQTLGPIGNSPKPPKIGPILAQYLGNSLRFCQIFRIFSNSKLT